MAGTLLATSVMSFFLKVGKAATKAAGAVNAASKPARRFDLVNEWLQRLVWSGKNEAGRSTQFWYTVAEDGRVLRIDNMANDALDTGLRFVERAHPNLHQAYGLQGGSKVAFEEAVQDMGFFEICLRGQPQVGWVATAPEAADLGSHALHHLQRTVQTMPGSSVKALSYKAETVAIEETARSVAPVHAPSNAPSSTNRVSKWELFKNLGAPAYFSDPDSMRQFWRRVVDEQSMT